MRYPAMLGGPPLKIKLMGRSYAAQRRIWALDGVLKLVLISLRLIANHMPVVSKHETILCYQYHYFAGLFGMRNPHEVLEIHLG